MMQSEQIAELATALAKCQGEMSFAVKDSINPHFKNRYADLASVWDAIRIPLSRNGLSVTQTIDIQGEKTVLISTLMHTSGQWIKSIIPVLCAQSTSQALGSGLSYARRYALAALVGCVQDDDDGEASMPKAPAKVKPEDLIIKPDQVGILTELLRRCSPEFQKQFNSNLEALGITLVGVKQKQFDTYKSKLLEEANRYQDKPNDNN